MKINLDDENVNRSNKIWNKNSSKPMVLKTIDIKNNKILYL